MCWAMTTGLQNQEGVPGNHLRKQLAVAIRSIQWSYAIFWSISNRQQWVLEWGDGYYNGDIKTRKTVQPMEQNVDQMGLQRSEQLRELYKSLLAGDTNQKARRPSAALSPENLTGAEWYYLVGMSFVFNPGQGMPGRALATGQSIWLCNAHNADGKVFRRSLLAKSASMQTVVCFPFLGGVIELGVTQMVAEDSGIIQLVKSFFLEFPSPAFSKQFTSSPQTADDDEELVCAEFDHEIIDNMALEKLNQLAECEMQLQSAPQRFSFSVLPYMPKEETEFNHCGIEELHANICEDLVTVSPHDSPNGCRPNQQTEDSYMLEGINGGASQVQTWKIMDDEFGNCVHGSMDSSDCISQTFVNPEKGVLPSNNEKMNNHNLHDLHECCRTKFSSLDVGTDDMHYSRILAAIFKNTDQIIMAPCFCYGNHKSSFSSWKSGGLMGVHKPQIRTPQKVLKKILFEVSWMHGGSSHKSQEENGGKGRLWKLEGNDVVLSQVFSERKRRGKLNEKFLALGSLVPSVSKVDKASILGNTIAYVKELEKRINMLESCRESMKFEARARRKHPDLVERTSDNYGNNDAANGKKKHPLNKRKACDIDETEPNLNWALQKEGLAAEVTVSMTEEEVLIEIWCPRREYLLIDIMDAVSNFHLDAHSVQSSIVDGFLSVTLKSKFRAAAVASASMIKQELQRVVSNC